MKSELLPGYMQDCYGRTYQYLRHEDGTLTQVFVEPPALSDRTLAMLAPVEVESQGRRGTTYISMQCYQGRNA